MDRLRRTAGGLMLLSGVTHTARFVFADPSPLNSPLAAGYGVACFVVGVLLLRRGRGGLWLGAVVTGIGGLVGVLLLFLRAEPLSVFHALISCFVALVCIYELIQPRSQRVATLATTLVLPGVVLAFVLLWPILLRDPLLPTYEAKCSDCHGANLEGAALGPALVGHALRHGDSVAALSRSIADGFSATGMPAWVGILNETQIHGLALLIAERRAGFDQIDFKVERPLVIPEATLESERHDFRIETVARNLHPRPYSIAPLPDGRILLSEKTRGLSIIGTDGQQSELIEGTPPAHDDGLRLPPNGLVFGLGWMMDVALHPNYEENGWIYLHFGDRCSDCATSMNKLIRGRIENGRWVDEETIWQADPDTYTITPDMAAGGRVSFDHRGHVFLSVGMKGYSNYDGIQDLGRPYGKIHRVHDDGRIPADNPFVDEPAALPSIWTYGHRSPQGLEFDPATGRLWSTEMGPRGGDELNLLMPGRNYGWPLTSKGLDYDGTPVEYGIELGIEPDMAAIEQPVVDMTPSPAVSSFMVYRGTAFPEWQDDLIVGTLKATELYRWELEGDRVVHAETLVEDLARIRDVEAGPDGAIYLLLEHASGGQIVRLVANP